MPMVNRKTLVEFLPSGSTELNLAISGDIYGAWPRARVTNIVGDGSSGKTVLALEGCYQYLKNIYDIKSKLFTRVKKAKVVFNNGEGVMDFPVEDMYKGKFNELVEWRRSPTIESVGRDFLKEAELAVNGNSLFYVIDSWDSFRSIHDSKITCTAKDEDMLSGYSLEKQKFAWLFFSQVCSIVDNNKYDATLIVISQTRTKIGVTFGKKKYRTGGDALNFYTHLVPWIREVEKTDKTKLGEKRPVSIVGEAKVERTKVGLPFRTANFKVLFDYGIDDIGSMARYLKTRKYDKWNDISLADLHKFSLAVEKNNLHRQLSEEVGAIHKKIEGLFASEVNQRQAKIL